MQIAASIGVAFALLVSGVPVGHTPLTSDADEEHQPQAPPLAGEVLLNDTHLCTFDSRTAEGVPWGILDQAEPKPDTWATAGPHPQLLVRLLNERRDFTLLGPGDALIRIKMDRTRVPDAPTPTYRLDFSEALPPGDYEFGGTEGRTPLFFRCGFTVED